MIGWRRTCPLSGVKSTGQNEDECPRAPCTPCTSPTPNPPTLNLSPNTIFLFLQILKSLKYTIFQLQNSILFPSPRLCFCIPRDLWDLGEVGVPVRTSSVSVENYLAYHLFKAKLLSRTHEMFRLLILPSGPSRTYSHPASNHIVVQNPMCFDGTPGRQVPTAFKGL